MIDKYGYLILFITLGFSLSAQNENVTIREIPIIDDYLIFPIQTETNRTWLNIDIDGETLNQFGIYLARDSVDFYTFLDVKRFKGENATISVHRNPKEAADLNSTENSNNIPGFDSLYREKLRPQFHFTARRGWLNDPNGLVYNNGTYHLFFQHNRFGWSGGGAHWGHATSADLVHWEEQPIALYPTKMFDWIFSGSAVVDHQNSSGFGSKGNPPLVAVYTEFTVGEALAYSLDNGQSFTVYKNNPVLTHEYSGRDPKVFWYEPGKHWVMVIYDEKPNCNEEGVTVIKKSFDIHTSTDLKSWKYQSTIDDLFECPELFSLPVDGHANNEKWIVYGSTGDYYIGDFDGKKFTKESGPHDFHHGYFYASQLFNNVPSGRKIQMAWMRDIDFPGMPFNQMMTFPVELSLKTTQDGIRLFANPVSEVENLHQKYHTFSNITLSDTSRFSFQPGSKYLHIKASIRLDDPRELFVVINGYELKYSMYTLELNGIFLRPENNRLELEILADTKSMEIFANGGRLYIPDSYHSQQPETEIYTTKDLGRKGVATIEKLDIFELKSIWNSNSKK